MEKEQLCQVLYEYYHILNMRSIEFFAAKNWLKVEEEWREYLKIAPVEEVIAFIASHKEIPRFVPESLKNLKSKLQRLVYDRKCVQTPKELWEKWTGTVRQKGLKEKFPIITSNGLIRKRIKAKKQHEIDRIVELVSQIQTFQNEKSDPIDSLVDIGAGVGHLSRMISLKNNLAVMAVEGNQQFTITANCLDEKLLQDSAKIGGKVEDLKFNTTPTRYTNFVTEELSSKIDDFAENAAILVGLHCCGDFSSTILKVFRKSQKAKCLVLLGCCYHKEFQCFHFLHPEIANEHESEDRILPKSSVFPLSKKWADFELSYLLREIACHNNENLTERFQQQNIDISRYARAHLEKWIWQISDNPDDRSIGMCSVKCVEGQTTFEEYIRKAMAKRGNHLLEKVLNRIHQTELSTLVSTFRSSQFDSFDAIRLIFAPAIESAILDDRLEFLMENGINSKIVPLFEPKISPRNLAIVAYKN